MTAQHRSILILGASYGSLLAAKLVLAGYDTQLVCLPETVRLINKEGIRVRLPVRGVKGLVEIDSRQAAGRVEGACTDKADPAAHDLVVLAMQEPQYSALGVRELIERVARSGVPCVSVMNMPPPPFLQRLPGLDTRILHGVYREPELWDAFAPEKMTLASPDPQAYRPSDQPENVLVVGLPTNFKVGSFPDPRDTALLQELERDIQAVRYIHDGEELELPVKLRVHESPFVALAKWPMLLTGNYRCILAGGEPISICQAVHENREASQAIYAFVATFCTKLGAACEDLVPFDKYAKAAESLGKPSSVARALSTGAPAIERVDRLVLTLAKGLGLFNPELSRIVDTVDEVLRQNAQASARDSASRDTVG